MAQARENLKTLETGQTKNVLGIAKFYDHSKQYKAAVIYYNDVIKNQPGSPESEYAKTRVEELRQQFGEDALVFVLGFTTENVARFPFVQSDVAVAVNAALREAGIEIPVPQRIVHLEQNDATKHSLGRHRADAGGNLPSRGGENLADTPNSNPNPDDRSQTDSS